MGSTLPPEQQRLIERVADEPFYWVRKYVPQVKDWEDEFYDLVDRIKGVWDECRPKRVNLGFILKWELTPTTSSTKTIHDHAELQKKQNEANSTLIFELDLRGSITDEIDIQQEIETTSLTVLSQVREAVIFWLGPDLEIFCRGIRWNPQNKLEILKDIKSKKRDRLLSMESHRAVLQIHYEQHLLGSGVNYWFVGLKNEVLVPRPERVFQYSLYLFLRDLVEGTVDIEPMFKDFSRCDVRVIDNFDIYFIEVKWIGYCAVKPRGSSVISAVSPTEFKVKSAIDGAKQTKIYIDKNNSIEYDDRIKLGIIVVYDAYPIPKIIPYPKEVIEHPLLDTLHFPLVTAPPSVVSKTIVKGTVTPSRTNAKKPSKRAASTPTRSGKTSKRKRGK